ncbi:MAG: hypothetical protein HZB33_10035 [Nitrospirae bacterium]|nr:hypothetical protein [Nitrospirota bacterium]
MTGRSILFTLAVFLGSCAGPSAATQALREEKVIVRFAGLNENAAREVLALYPLVRTSLMKDLGWSSDMRPEIVLVKDRAAFRKFSGSEHISAFAVSGKDLIVVDYSKMGGRPFTLETTLKHELCHLELHRHITDTRLPRWLDEGICQWVTGGAAEILTAGGRSLLTEAALSDRFIGMQRLTDDFPSDGKGMLLAYEESKSIVEFIIKTYGDAGLRGILGHMHRGDDLENAVLKSLSISLNELEKRWRASLSEKASWPAYLRDNLYEALFLFAALITVCGFFRAVKKRREYKDDEDEPDIREDDNGA